MVQRRIVASEGDAHVRHVFDLEVMSVLRRIYFAGQFTEERADRALYRLETINITRHSHAPFLRRIREPRHNVTAYEAAYNSVPGSYSMHAYDAALLIDSALKSTGGKMDNKDAVRAAIKKADFKSLRGDFKFGTNGFPVQDFYLVKAAKRSDGKFQTEIVEKVFDDYTDAYAKECAAAN